MIGIVATSVPFVAVLLGWSGKSAAIVGVIILGVLAAASKAMHYDGLADTADALMSGKPPATKLEIMEDSAVGAFGATAVAFAIAAQSAALSGIVQTTAWYSIIIATVVARFGVAVAAWTLRPAREKGLGAPLTGRPSAGTAALACLTTAALGLLSFVRVGDDWRWIALASSPFAGWPVHQAQGFVASLAAALLAALVLPRLLARPVRGVTGDILGATIVLTTLLTFAAAALFG